MKRLITFLLFITSISYGQSNYVQVGNTLQRKIVGIDTNYRVSLGSPGVWNLSDRFSSKHFLSGNYTPYTKANYLASSLIQQHAQYAFLDNSVINYLSYVYPQAHASFDCGVTITGNFGSDHHHAFQDASVYEGTDTLTYLTGYYTLPTVRGTGVVKDMKGFAVFTPADSGTIINRYAFFADGLNNRADSLNYAFYSQGSAPSRLGGTLSVIGEGNFTGIVRSSDFRSNPSATNQTYVRILANEDEAILSSSSLEDPLTANFKPLNFYTSDTLRLGVGANGYVGINKLSDAPTERLDVNGNVNISGVYKVNGVAISSGTVSNVTSANSDISVASGTTTPILTLNSGAGANQIVKRNGSGNIADLASYLPLTGGSLTGALNVVGGATNSIFSTGNDIKGYINATGSSVQIASTYGSTGSFVPLIFYTSDVARMQIAANGVMSTANLDVYDTDLSGSYTARTKIDKGYADAAYEFSASENTTSSNIILSTSGWYTYTGGTGTWTLPVVTGNTGKTYRIKNRGSGILTINANSGTEVYTTTGVVGVSLTAGSSIVLHNDGGFWSVHQ